MHPQSAKAGNMDGPISVLFFVDGLEIGGTSEELVRLLARLDKGRFDPTVVTLFGALDRAPLIRDLGLEVRSMDWTRSASLKTVFCLIGMMRDQNVDLIQTFYFRTFILGTLSALLARVPAIISYQNDTVKHRWIWTLLYRFLMKHVDLVIANSKACRDFAHQRYGADLDKIEIIYSGIAIDVGSYDPGMDGTELRQQLGLSEEDKIVGTVSRLAHRKGHQYLIEAAPIVLTECPNAKFVFAGDGDSRSLLEEQARRLGIADKAHFLGFRSDISSVLAAFDVFVLPSLHGEGLPNSILEAMAMAKPVVTTDTAGNNEVVTDGDTGVVVPPYDSEALAQAIISLLKDPAKACSMGLAGRKRIENEFDCGKSVRRAEGLYRKLHRRKTCDVG